MKVSSAGLYTLNFIYCVLYFFDIAADIDINSPDGNGLTPLMWSAAYGQVPTAALLLRNGSLHSAKGLEGETAIHLAAAGGHTEIIRLLISAGASVDETDDVSG